MKAAFTDPGLQRRHRLTAANSINIGRLLPQVAYHAAASLWHWRRHGTSAGSIVPSGNLGNGMACVWARAMGLPVREIVLAVNANRTIPDYLATGQWQPRAERRDAGVGDGRRQPEQHGAAPQPAAGLRRAAHEHRVLSRRRRRDSRADRARTIERYGEVWCPHTATAFWVYDHLPPARKAGRPWIVSATAHPAKFETIVEPVIGRAVPVPPALAALLERPTASTPLAPRLEQLAAELDSWK